MQRLFDPEKLHELEKLAIRNRLWHRDVRPLLLDGLSEDYQAHLPEARSGRAFLGHTLRHMNSTPLLGDGVTCPLLVWLRNAMRYLDPIPAASDFEAWARACEDRLHAATVDNSFPHLVFVSTDARVKAAERLADSLASSGASPEAVAAAREGVLEIRRAERDGPILTAKQWLGDRFLLLERIGEGGFASVWRAWDRQGGAQVAVKALHARRAENRTHRERFLRGARRMARLEHPGIARIVEPHCIESGLIYFVTAYSEGGDLRDAVLGGGISPEQGLRIILEVADALAFAHEQGCVHRDVKPSNILLAADGTATLSDFDLVWAADTTGGTDGGLGTPFFAAPEMNLPAETADPSVDVYGLAMTMAFVLHGAPLPMSSLRHHDRFLSQLNCSEDIRRVLVRATETNPSHRHPSVRAFASALGRAAREPRVASRAAVDTESDTPEPSAAAVSDPPHGPEDVVEPSRADEPGGPADAAPPSAPEWTLESRPASVFEAPLVSPRSFAGPDPAEAGDARAAVDPSAHAHRLRTEHRQHEELIRRFGILFVVFGTMIAIGLVASGVPVFDKPIVLGSSLLSGVIGGGLGMLAPWARWPAVIGSIGLLFWYPIGTILGVFVLYLTLSPKGAFVLTGYYREIIRRAPDVPHEGGLGLGCLTLSIAGGLSLAGVLIFVWFNAQ